ncbi:DUF4224 domain-containing protein [Ottowia sp.]|uniref:DUF4224 domain-containing protein n=1 Tax=Ottowia sp. TaxID=1898956 RepID=UPI00342829BB
MSASVDGGSIGDDGPPPWLTELELRDATHRVRPSAQARALQSMGVPFRRRLDGTLLVGREAIARVLEAKESPLPSARPNWSKPA